MTTEPSAAAEEAEPGTPDAGPESEMPGAGDQPDTGPRGTASPDTTGEGDPADTGEGSPDETRALEGGTGAGDGTDEGAAEGAVQLSEAEAELAAQRSSGSGSSAGRRRRPGRSWPGRR